MSSPCRCYKPEFRHLLCAQCGRGPDDHLPSGPAVVQLGEPLGTTGGAPAILICQPSGLSPSALVWRERIVTGLSQLGFHGYVLVPEHRPGAAAPLGRPEWRRAARQLASVALYWLTGRCSATTFLLLEADARVGKAVLGYAPGSVGTGFLAAVAKRRGVPVFPGDLRALLVEAVVRAEAI